MDYNTLLIDALRAKQYITLLEKDILDTWNELRKYPFDMNSAERQVISNDINHPKIAAMVTAMPTAVQKPRENITYNHGRSYELDFVVETEDIIYLVEVKGEDKLNNSDVIAKKKRGIQYCEVATR